MTKITVDLLLKKGLPKSSRLKDLKKLNLSNMHLEAKDINSQLFSQMVNLEELDLSKNSLSELPENLDLHNLKVLNFSDNQVDDITILKQFPKLEEVMYEDNIYLTTSDNYKVYCLLPKLRRLNNKDITSQANHVRFVNHRELSNRVEAYWEKNYKDKLPINPSSDQIKAVGKDFLKSVTDQVKYGPNSLKDFTKWKVEIIAKNLISSISGSKDTKTDSPLETCEDNVDIQTKKSPSKKRRDSATDCKEESPTKKPRILSDVLSVSLSPRRSSRIQESPLKITPIKTTQDNAISLQASKIALDMSSTVTSKSTPSKHQPKDERMMANGKQNSLRGEIKNKRELDNVEPLHFIQCHSKNNSCEDFTTQLWACAFEPNLDPSSRKVIATCGGESVCVIDCDTGKVMKKYKVTGEEFFTLAWTTLTMVSKDGQKRKINVLATGGTRGAVRLIHAKVNLCYGEIKAHKKAISIMCFSPKQETFLFTGSYDKRIILWDIGVPDVEYNFRASQLLTLDTTAVPLRLCPVPSCPDQYLMAACEDGCFVWDIKLNQKQGRRSYHIEVHFPTYKKEGNDEDFHCVDGLAFLNEDIVASKSLTQGSIYLWSWEKSFKTQKSRASKKLDAAVLAELKWANTDIPYLALSTSPAERNCVFCGDDTGKVWVYDLDPYTAELMKGIPCSTLKDPTKILDWPSLSSLKEKLEKAVVNTVAVDPTLHYIVALTDKNIVAIWKII
ncbi:leucine-rich repeat and WD repeat-containing protein 1 [Rhinophrynus dorsalis]